MPHSHRPTTKHKHKSFKSGHASSRVLKDIAKGRIQPDKKSTGVVKVHTKADRRNLAKQIQNNKKQSLRAQGHIFGDGRGRCSRICAIVPVCGADARAFVMTLRQQYDPDSDLDNIVHIPSFKQRLEFRLPASTTVRDYLDLVACSDFVILLASAEANLAESPHAMRILRSLQAQGTPTIVTAFQDLHGGVDSMFRRSDKQAAETRKMWEDDIKTLFPASSSFSMESTSEVAQLVRSLCTSTPESPSWRYTRGYVVVEQATMTPDGEYVVEGVTRGEPLDVNQRIYLDGFGDFAVSRISAAPHGIEESETLATRQAPEEDILDSADIDIEALPEQTSPEERLRRGVRLDDHYYVSDDEDEVAVEKRLPKGTSSYQAAWITNETEAQSDEELADTDDNDDNDNDDDDEDENMAGDDFDTAADDAEMGESAYAPTTMGGEGEHVDLSEEENARQLARFRAEIADDQEFPDEVDWDPSIPARDRFRKYRGLKDFGQSVWDPEEIEPNTPSWWRRVLRFEHYSTMRNRLLKVKPAQPVTAGRRIRLYIKDVPARISTARQPLAIWFLHQYEDRPAVVNLSIQLEPDVDPIKSKEELVVQVGSRRFMVNPIFSQHVATTRNGLVRYERFCQPGRRSMASFTGPCVLDRAGLPVLYFRRNSESTSGAGDLELVATGSFVNCDHARMPIKRVLLTGESFKVHKRVVTVRFMFNSREDVRFFKALKLRTKGGRTGFIREPLGTHGYMKTTWDGPLKGQDTIAMPLYKRIYPRKADYFVD
ncbi:ribosome bioproteinsis protein tsr1 [Savitreella phatthalungensis]